MKKPAKDASIPVAGGKNVRKRKRTPRQASGKRIRLKKSRDKAAPDAVVAPEEPRAKTPSSDEALLAEAQALAHLGSWAWDIAADVVSWSDELYRIMGLEPQQCPVTYQVFLKCVHPEDRERIHRVVQQSLSDHQPFSFDYRVILPSKAVRIQHGKGAVITDDRGRAARMHGTAQDITEQKQAAEDLRHSEQRFAAFMDNLPGFAWMKDVKGRYLYRNKRMMEIPGFRENWSGKTDADFWPPEVAAQYRASDLKVITSRASLQTVEYHPSVNRGRYLLVSKFPIFDQAGAVTMVAGAGVDVTERIQTEQARAQLAAIVESSNDAIIGGTFEDIITSWNAAAEKIYGYSAAEILGRSLALLRPPEIPDPMPALRPRLKRGERIDNFETIRLRKDGSRVHVSVSLSPIKSPTGEITGISGISRDITERKRIEKALESAEEQYRSIFNNAVDGIFRTSPDGKFLVANPAAAHIFGFASPEELIEKRRDIAQQSYVDPRRREEFKRLIQEQGIVSGFEHEAYRKDGSRVWISENTRAVHSPSGEILYFEGIFEDITERKRAEEKLWQSLHLLRGITEGTTDAMYAKDREGRYLMINTVGAGFMGKIPEQMIGLDDNHFFSGETLARIIERDRAILTTGETRTDEDITTTPAGMSRVHLTTKGPLRDSSGAIVGLFGVSRDITERKREEALLQESEARTRLLVKSSNIGLWDWNLVTNAVFFSPEWKSQLGHADDEVPGRYEEWESRLHPEDREPSLRAVQDFREGRRKDYDTEFRLRHKDGSWRSILTRGDLIRDAAGQPVRMLGCHVDITERKRAEEALRESQQRYESLVQSIDGIVWEVDAETFRFTFVSKQAERILGYPSAQWLEPNFWADHVHRDDRDSAVGFCVDATQKRVDHQFDYRMIAADGRAVWLSDLVTVHVMEDRSVRLRGVMFDITERKQAEEALRESEERFRTIFEQAPLGISEGEIATARFVSANQRYADILGYTIDELRALTFKDYTHPEDLQKDLVEFQKLAAGEIRTYAMEKRYIRKDGAIIWVNLTVSPLAPPGEEPLNCMAVIEDITERRQAEEALKESEQQMRLFMQATADCLWNWDLITGNVVRSVGFNRVFGYAVEDVDSSLTWWEERLHPDDRERVVSTFHDTIASGGNAYSYEYRFRRKDGTLAVIHDRAHIVRDAKGKPLSALGAMTDITERKEAEEALQNANRQLQILSRRLFQVQEDEKRHLARELHDEMGQALTAVKINLQSARSLDDPADLARRLGESIGILDGLLQQTRRLSFDLRPPLLDDLGLVPALRSYLDEQAQRAGFRATFFADPRLERLSAEIETACFRVAQQALTNTVRHAEARTVHVELHFAPHALHLIVRDDGRGFDVEAAEERARRGGSLGLPGMRERLSLLGGELDCKSTPGRGTEVHAFLPLEIDSHVSGLLS